MVLIANFDLLFERLLKTGFTVLENNDGIMHLATAVAVCDLQEGYSYLMDARKMLITFFLLLFELFSKRDDSAFNFYKNMIYR